MAASADSGRCVVKRDMDLVRQILLACEASQELQTMVRLSLKGYKREVVSYHVELMHDAGLVTAMDASSSDGHDWRPTGLTWAGHEFLDAARSDTVWEKAKSSVGAVGGVAFEVIKNVLVSYGTQQASRLMGMG